MNPIITLRDVSKSFEVGGLAVSPTNLTINRGEFVSLLGPSGCGKSTILKMITGLLLPTSGEVAVRGKVVRKPQTEFGVVFQSATLLEWLNVYDNVVLQMAARPGDAKQYRRRALELIERIGLKGHESKMPPELSGGMQQRVALCRALLHDPEILVMDEPFGALDAITRDQMCIDLQMLWSKGEKTVIFVTHDISEAVFLSDRVVVMADKPGRIDFESKIELERPRKLAVRDSAFFVDNCRQIRTCFERNGILREG